MKYRIAALIVTALAIPVSFINAPYPRELVLQHIPTVIGVAVLAWVTARFSPSRISLACCIGFLWLHLIGARWIYSYVPYDDWSVAVTGKSLSDYFHWKRNHYDRLVHLASGVLGVPPIAEWLRVRSRLSAGEAAVLSIASILAIGAIYEVLEWQIAITLSPNMAESYNGQQGDIWDPQKDLALAGLGALISAIAVFISPSRPLGK